MKKTMNLIVALVLILGMISTVAAGAPPTSQVVELDGTPSPQPSPAVNPDTYTPINPDAILYDNGPLVTHAAACSGMDASRLQTDLVMNTLGFGHQFTTGYRMADDFTIPAPGGWQIDQITFFAYQTGAPSSPTPIVGVYYQIWDGPPDDAGSTVVFGDLTTNRFQKSESHNLQRDSVTSPCANNRYIYANVANAGTTLPPGTYWLDWMTDGSASYSGPWAPPVTILGQTTTGNALQYTTAWAPALDTGSATQQGMPFIVEGSQLVSEPDIEVSPSFLTADQAPDEVTTQVLTIINNGTADLHWGLSEEVVLGTLAGSMPFKPAQVKSIGMPGNGKISVSSPASALGTPEASANPQAVLWDQPLSAVNQNAYVNQEFGDFPTSSSFLADDFVNAEPWNINTIFVPGDLWNGATTLLSASALTWQIYADAAGVPAGDPSGGGVAPVWSFTLLPTDPQVALSVGTPGGWVSNATLNLATPVTVPAGHWWLVFYPTMDFGTAGQYGRQPADTANGFTGQFINPGGGFGLGTAWQNWTVLGAAQTDIAFRIEGEVGFTDIPWLSESPITGTVPGGFSQDIDVTFDSTGLAPGTYMGSLLVDSNDPDEPQVVVPVTLNVLVGGNTLHLDKMKSFVRPFSTGRKFVQVTWVHDQNMQLVEGARVWGEWTYPNGKILPSFLRLTNGTGFARFVLKTFMPGLYQFCVTDITLAGYTYDPLQNEVDPCVSFVAP